LLLTLFPHGTVLPFALLMTFAHMYFIFYQNPRRKIDAVDIFIVYQNKTLILVFNLSFSTEEIVKERGQVKSIVRIAPSKNPNPTRSRVFLYPPDTKSNAPVIYCEQRR
jgi:hypothetical protein